MEDERTEVLDNVDGSPGDLGTFFYLLVSVYEIKICGVGKQWHTEVLDEELPLLDHVLMLPDKGILVLQRGFRHRVKNTNPVEVGDARGLGQLLLHVLDVGILGQVDRGRKTLDGLLGS